MSAYKRVLLESTVARYSRLWHHGQWSALYKAGCSGLVNVGHAVEVAIELRQCEDDRCAKLADVVDRVVNRHRARKGGSPCN